jgi:hypothetical protein
MPPFTIRPADKFPEPEFSRMQRLVFADVQQESAALDTLLQGEASGAPSAAQHAPMFRLGAYLNPDFPLGAPAALLGAQRTVFGHFAPSFVVNSLAIDFSRVAKLTQNPPRWPLES